MRMTREEKSGSLQAAVHYYIQFLTKIDISKKKPQTSFIKKIPANFKLLLRTGKHMVELRKEQKPT